MLVNGIVTIPLGVMIGGQWPVSGTYALGILVAVRLVREGTALVTLGSGFRRDTKAAA